MAFSGRLVLEGFEHVDDETSTLLIMAAEKKANIVGEIKKKLGMPSTTQSFSLQDGVVCTIADLSHIKVLRVSIPPDTYAIESEDPESQEENEYTDTLGVYDVISGKVLSHSLVDEEVTIRDGFVPPDQADDPKHINYVTGEYQVLNGFTACSHTLDRYTLDECRYRLAIPPHSMYGPFMNDFGTILYSQYTYILPSMFSGAMRRVVQLLLGVGQVLIPRHEETLFEPVGDDPSQLGPLPDTLTDIATNAEVVVKSAFKFGTEEETQRVQVQYDYRFQKTHGIIFDSASKPWVIEVQPGGVFAIPLYMDPVSLTEEGRARYIEVSPELEEFMDEFGGFPTFEPFPSGVDFDDYFRSGEIIQLRDAGEMSAFFSGGAYSSDMGWTFSETGREAHNTCSKYTDPGFSKSHHYKLTTSLGTEQPFLELTDNRLTLHEKMTELWEKNKCLRMTEDEAEEIMKVYVPRERREEFNPTEEQLKEAEKAGREAFDDLVITPKRDDKCSLTLVRSGITYNGANFAYQPQIKFPESLVNGLLSFDFGAYNTDAKFNPAYASMRTKQDAPMHVCYINGGLQIVNYFTDYTPLDLPPEENDRQPCQFTGNWLEITFGGSRSIMGNFYSNVWDTRIESTSTTTITEYSGTKMGAQARAAQPFWPAMCIYTSTIVHFSVEHKTYHQGGKDLSNAVAIPAHCRNSYAVQHVESMSSDYTTTGIHFEQTPGPIGRVYGIYHPIVHWWGCGFPLSKVGSGIALLSSTGVSDSCVSEDAAADFYYSNPIDPPGPATHNGGTGGLGSTSWGFNPGPLKTIDGGEPQEKSISWEVKIFADGLPSNGKSTKKGKLKNPPWGTLDTDTSVWWYKASPTDTGEMPFMAISQSCLGNAIINYHTDLDGFVTKSAGSNVEMYGSVYTAYTGVVK